MNKEKEGKYFSTKTFGHELGLSCAFRQWKAESHCRFLHGYALSIKLVFETTELDARNWVVDFGSLKEFKEQLQNTFDHKTLVAEDDPLRDLFELMHAGGLADVVLVEKAGCEAFAKMIFACARIWLQDAGYYPRCDIHLVEVREHGANSAIYMG